VLAKAGDHLEQRALSTTRWPQDGEEMPPGKSRADFREQHLLIVAGADLEGDVLKFEHGRDKWRASRGLSPQKSGRFGKFDGGSRDQLASPALLALTSSSKLRTLGLLSSHTSPI
jgi:hypothetical protein